MSSQNQRSAQLDSPCIMGYMSVDRDRRYHPDLSQLKYLTSIPKRKLDYNLNHNMANAIKRTAEESEEKLTLLLKFLLDRKHYLKFLHSPDITFVTYRRILINVMICTQNQDPVSIVASLFNNCIYLCSVDAPSISAKASALTEQFLKISSWGYKLKQYMLSGKLFLILCIIVMILKCLL